MTPATLKALAAELPDIAREHDITGHSLECLQKAAALLEQIGGADAGCTVMAYLCTVDGLSCATSSHKKAEIYARAVGHDGKPTWDVQPLILQTDHLAALAAAQAPAEVGRDAWISVDERLPEKNTEVLVAFDGISIPSTGQYTGSARDKHGWCYPAENYNSCDDGTDPVVIAWQPLPPPPIATHSAKQGADGKGVR